MNCPVLNCPIALISCHFRSPTEATPATTTTQWQWKPDNDNNDGQWKPDNDGSYNPGQWEWKPPTTTTTETTFIETSNVAEPYSGDYKMVCCKLFF